MKNINNFYKLLIILLFISCGKEKSVEIINGEGDATIEINISTVAGDNSNEDKQASSKAPQLTINDFKQDQTIELGEGHKLIATLIDETLLSKNTKIANAINRNQQLAQNTSYRVIVYNMSGDYVTHKDYQYGSESQAGNLMLIGGTGGTEYTFVVYSLNKTDAIPAITGLSTTKIQNVNLTVNAVQSDFMFFKKTLRVSKGNNKLNVELAHLFSQITTTILLTNETEGFIKSISNPVIRPSAGTASINFGTGVSSLTFGAPTANGSPVTFPAISGTTTKSITSSPAYVAANAPLSGTFNIGELNIAAVVNGAPTPEPKDVVKAVSVPNVNIIPGHRYKLILEYKVPCLQVITTGDSRFAWYDSGSATSPISRTITMPASDFGYKFDIYYLDNSFNMTINGTRLTVENRQIQFQAAVANNPVNVSFLNNNTHGTNSSQIYDIKNFTPVTSTTPSQWVAVAAKPALRIVIDSDGSVSLWGARYIHDSPTGSTSLEKMKVISPLTNGITLQKVTWNKSTTNNITVTQTVTGPTAMFGIGSGLQIIRCPE